MTREQIETWWRENREHCTKVVQTALKLDLSDDDRQVFMVAAQRLSLTGDMAKEYELALLDIRDSLIQVPNNLRTNASGRTAVARQGWWERLWGRG